MIHFFIPDFQEEDYHLSNVAPKGVYVLLKLHSWIVVIKIYMVDENSLDDT